jgi:phage-related protein
MGNTMRGLRNIVVGIGAALTTGLVAKAITDFAGKGDEIAKTSRMLGLSAEALQELRYAANLQGVENEQLTQSMKLLNNNLGDLKAKQGALYSQLKVTNPQLARQLRDVKSTEEGFNFMVDAIARETNTAKRAALAQATFGKSGQELIKMAEVGTVGLAALRKEAHKYGAVISSEAAADSEKFSDSMDRLKKSIGGVVASALAPLIKTLQPVIQRFAEWVAANRELIAQKISSVFQTIGKAVEFLAPFLKAAVDLLKWLKPALPYIAIGILALVAAQWAWNVALTANPIGLIIAGIGALIAIVIVIIRYWQEITTWVNTAWTAVKSFAIGIWNTVIPYLLAFGQTLLKYWLLPINLVISAVVALMNVLGKLPGKVGAPFRDAAKAVGGFQDKFNKMLTGTSGIADFGGIWKNAVAASGSPAPVSPNAALASGIGQMASTVSESRSTVDVNLNNLPAGTAVRQRGRAPGITVNTGFAFGGAR